MENRYLTGNFAPVRDELTTFDLPVDGALPPELSGRLLRIGPNPVTPPADPAAYHWFIGDGMLHAIELGDGRAVSYRNRWVRTDQVCEALGEEPPPGQPDDVFPVGSSVANTNVVSHAGRIFALVEVCLPTEVTGDLETVGRHDYGGRLRSAMTAHPKVDPVTGELLFFGYDIFGPPWLRYHVVDAAGELVRTEAIDVKGPTMIHDFAVTESHVVFFDLPVVFSDRFLGQRSFPAGWDPDYGARVGVMPRDGGNADVRWFDIEPCYVFHPLNAYDDGDDVVVDVVRHERMFDTDLQGPAESSTTLDRWTVDLSAGKVTEARLDDRGQEFPRIDDRRLGRRHRYGYATALDISVDSDWAQSSLLKHDLARGITEVHDLGPGRAASEGVFVAAGPGEDEGYVLATVYDAARDGSDLVVLDASDFAAPPVATVRLPQRVPFGFHGNWVPDA